MGTSRMITYNLELTWTIHFEMICMRRRIIGLLQSQDLDGKPTFGFIVTGWSVNELFCLKAPRGGIVLVVVEDDRVLWRSTWFVEKEDWDFRLIELFLSLCLEGVTEDCRSRLYGNVLIKKYPPPHTQEEVEALFFYSSGDSQYCSSFLVLIMSNLLLKDEWTHTSCASLTMWVS